MSTGTATSLVTIGVSTRPRAIPIVLTVRHFLKQKVSNFKFNDHSILKNTPAARNKTINKQNSRLGVFNAQTSFLSSSSSGHTFRQAHSHLASSSLSHTHTLNRKTVMAVRRTPVFSAASFPSHFSPQENIPRGQTPAPADGHSPGQTSNTSFGRFTNESARFLLVFPNCVF